MIITAWGAFRAIADKIPEQQVRIFLSIIKDTYLTGKIKKSRGAMFISLARAYAGDLTPIFGP